MSQLNIYLPPSDSLKSRLEQAAASLQTTPNTLARLVVDEFLETYVTVTAEAEDMKRHSFQDIHERLKSRVAALGVARFQTGTGEAEDRALDASRRMPRRRRGAITQRTVALAR
jgi:urate oxidase